MVFAFIPVAVLNRGHIHDYGTGTSFTRSAWQVLHTLEAVLKHTYLCTLLWHHRSQRAAMQVSHLVHVDCSKDHTYGFLLIRQKSSPNPQHSILNKITTPEEEV